ncbi:MAG: type II toxin-antitoxin system RelE family toxin [Gammaproteobacteria bacterium]
MAWKIELTDDVRKKLRKLDKPVAARILEFLEQRVAVLDNPRTLGDPLRGPELRSYWKYRVRNYRVIAWIRDEAVTVLVVRIGHRREVYRR